MSEGQSREEKVEQLALLSKEKLIERVLVLESQVAEKDAELERKDMDRVTGWGNENRAKWEFLNLIKESPELLDEPITVMSIDLKKLKEINDRYSHKAGDRLLEGFARYMDTYFIWLKDKYPYYAEHLKANIPFRFYEHGDEFGFILVGIGVRQQEEIEASLLKNPPSLDVKKGVPAERVNFSMGFASSNELGEVDNVAHLRQLFPDNLEFSAELLRHLKEVADIKEREKKRNG